MSPIESYYVGRDAGTSSVEDDGARTPRVRSRLEVWNPETLDWERMQQGVGATSDGLTNTQLRASALPISLDAAALAALETITVANPGLTDAQLRATAVPVSGPLTDAQLRAAAVSTSRARVDLVASAPATVSVAITSTSILAANADRKGLVLSNVSALAADRVFLAFDGAAAVANRGIALFAAQSWTMDDFTFTTGEVRAIGIAITTLSIQEFV